MSLHPVFADTLAQFGAQKPPADAAIARIRQLEAEKADLERQLQFKQEALAQFIARYEELVPRDTEAELPDGSWVIAPGQVAHDALMWLRTKHDLEWCTRIDEQTLLHFEVEKAEARIAAWEDRQS